MCQNLVLYMLPKLHNRMLELVEWLIQIFLVVVVVISSGSSSSSSSNSSSSQ